MRSDESRYKRIDHPIPPLYDGESRILILGSFPSVKSREAAFFYGHPQNRFWKTVAGVLSAPVPVTVEEKAAFLHENHIAVWDVIGSCDIVGSSDSSIRNVVPNDLSEILAAAPIRQIFCNGGKSYEYYCKYMEERTGMKAVKLPSTSPANAAWSLERLMEAWKVLCQPLGAAPAGIGEVLLSWYDYNARILPWRSDPSPYHVWISEIMLQQTRVEAVRSYYDRWMEELPDVAGLASVSDERLMKLWEGLGYYNRARNLKAAARMVMEEYGGILPASYQELLKLKGIGSYTAGAIASIAYGLPEIAVDGNVLRVFARLLGEAGEIDRPDVKRALSCEVRRVMPDHRYGDFNQALMDLGATVCLPGGRPDCGNCPWESLCVAHKQGRETDYPVKRKKKARRIEKLAVFVILIGEDQVLLHKRAETGLLPGLWEFPNLEGSCSLEKAKDQLAIWGLNLPEKAGADEAATAAEEAGVPKEAGTADYITALGPGKHIFTHVEWQMTGFMVRLEEVPEDICRKEGWVRVGIKEALGEYAIPSAFEKYRSFLRDRD